MEMTTEHSKEEADPVYECTLEPPKQDSRDSSLEYNNAYAEAESDNAYVEMDPTNNQTLKPNPAYGKQNYDPPSPYNRLSRIERKKTSGPADDEYSQSSKNRMLIVMTIVCGVACCSLVLAIAALAVANKAGVTNSLAQLPATGQCTCNSTENTVVNNLREELEHLGTQVDSLIDELKQLRTQQETNQENQTMLQSSVNTLTDRLNSSVNLYENCYEDVRVCNGEARSNRYRRQCSTELLPIDVDGQFTMSMRCEFRDNNVYLESAVLTPDENGNIQCDCKVTNALENTAGHFVMSGSYFFYCVLVITRCPTSQNVTRAN